jgi:lipopolysaccharide/colanic/teichoic acid biosynthesis glycosyltransferase
MFRLYSRYLKRTFDITAASLGLMVLGPLFIVLAVLVKVSSKGPVFYTQERLGRNFVPFSIIKFRSMVVNDASQHSLVTATGDARITPIGAWLRRYKLDELPQLMNVINGDMSLVGPRPEVARYIEHYRDRYAFILSVRPGITDNASIAFRNEEALLREYDDKEAAYIRHIMPQKMALYEDYIAQMSFWGDLQLIIKTII